MLNAEILQWETTGADAPLTTGAVLPARRAGRRL